MIADKNLHDPSQPYIGKYTKWEELAVLLTNQSITQHDAFLKVYPHATKWKRESVDVRSTRLCARIEPRVRYLREKATSAKILSITRRKEILSRIAAEIGDHDPADYMEAGADGVWITFGKESPNRKAVAGIKSRTEMTGEGDSKTEAVITELKLRSHSEAKDAIAELNKMDGAYAAEKHEHTVEGLNELMEAIAPEQFGAKHLRKK